MLKSVKKLKNEFIPAPVVTLMGHVDHGKTSILDAIRNTQVQLSEPGGITQHVRSHRVIYKDRPITFIDTPGHEAFSKMRSRGGKVADIVVLVVAGDDSVQPQTKEAIKHVRESGAEMIVAVNKIDLPGCNIEKVKQDLAGAGVMLEGWGGNVPIIGVSAKEHKNIDQLLDMILLVADMLELKADTKGVVESVVLESQIDSKKGAVSTILIKKGILKVKYNVYCNGICGKIRAIMDSEGNIITEANPTNAVSILGLDIPCEVGEIIYASEDANDLQNFVKTQEKENIVSDNQEVSLADLFDSRAKGNIKSLSIVLKADVSGTLEVIQEELVKLSDDEIEVKIISSGVGDITENDILKAKDTKGVVIGFHVNISESAAETASRERVVVRSYDIIYNMIDEIDDVLISLTTDNTKEILMSTLDVKQIFTLSDGTVVCGCNVLEKTCKKGYNCFLERDGDRVSFSKISSLRVHKDVVNEVKKGQECGVILYPQVEVEEGDKIVCYKIEKS